MSYNSGNPLRTSSKATGDIQIPVGMPLKCWMGLGTQEYLGVSISVKWVVLPHFVRRRRDGNEVLSPSSALVGVK